MSFPFPDHDWFIEQVRREQAVPRLQNRAINWIIKAAAFEGDVADAPALWQKWNHASTSLAQRELVAKKDGHWQQLTVTMVLPPNADFLVFECAVSQRAPVVRAGVAEFPAHYVDDVRVSVLRPHHDRQKLD